VLGVLLKFVVDVALNIVPILLLHDILLNFENLRISNPGNPVSWEPSVTGDRFPIRLNISHPLWQTFLDSGSISPLHFFRAFLAPPTYFQSPTPWNQGNRYSGKTPGPRLILVSWPNIPRRQTFRQLWSIVDS